MPARPRARAELSGSTPLPFVGRSSEIARLREALVMAHENVGTAWSLEGPAGSGKTTVAREVARLAEREGFQVRWGHALKGVKAPFFPFEQLFPGHTPARARAPSSPPPEEEPPGPATGLDLSVLAGLGLRTAEGPETRREIVPLAQLGMGAPSDEPAPAAPSMLFRILDELAAASRTRPLLVVLEDLQWADAQSVQAVDFLAKNVSALPVLLLLLLRADELSTPEALATGELETVERLGREERLHRLPLGPWAAADVARWAEKWLDGPVVWGGEEKEALGDLLTRTGGLPLAVVETLRQAKSSGLLRRSRGAWRFVRSLGAREPGGPEALPLLPELGHLLLDRVRAQPAEAREVLRYAALLGREFDRAPVQEVSGLSRVAFQRLVERLCGPGQLLREVPGGKGRLRIIPGLLWEALREDLPPAEVRERARTLAAWWAERRPEDPVEVARLYHEAEAPDPGLAWARKALDRAGREGAPEPSEQALAWWLDLHVRAGRPLPERLEEGRGFVDRVERTLGTSRCTERMWERLTSLGGDAAHQLPLRARRTWDRLMLRDAGAATELEQVETALREAGELPPAERKELELRLDVGRIFLALVDQRLAPLAALAPRVQPRLDDDSLDPWERAKAAYFLGWGCMQRDELADADRLLRRSRVLALSVRDFQTLARGYNLEGSLLEVQGHLREAHQAFRTCIVSFGRISGIANFATFLLNDAEVLTHLGEHEEARSVLGQARRVAEHFDLPWVWGVLLHREGDLALEIGETARAEELLRRALGVYREIGYREVLGGALLSRGRAELLLGKPDAVAATLQEFAVAGHEPGGGFGAVEATRRDILEAELEEAQGRPGPALELLQRAEQRSAKGENRWEQAIVAAARGAWERRHGTPVEAERWAREWAHRSSLCGIAPRSSGPPPAGAPGPAPSARPSPARARATAAARAPAPRTSGEVGAEGAPLSHRILLHLERHGGHAAMRPEGEGPAPYAWTQGGMAEALRVGQSHFAPALHRLVERGIVEVSTRHVEGEARRRKVYALTRLGRTMAAELKAGTPHG